MNAESPNNNTLPVPPSSSKGGANDTPAERYAAFLDYAFSPETHRRRYALTVSMLVLGIALGSGSFYLANSWHPTAWAGTVAGILIAARAMTLMHGMVRRAQLYGRRKQVARKGELVTAYVVHCPTDLLRPGQEHALPCRVVFSFQPEVCDDMRYMRYIATHVAELKDKLPRGDMDKQYIAALASEPQTKKSRRYLLPLSFTDGSAIYLADLLVSRAHLPGGYLHTDALPCLAEPGATGGIEMMPEWLLDPKKPIPITTDPLPPITDDAPLGLG
ncbi:MAG: hypothetical protein EON58_19850 [Alphaproteobacteria bacterium]|nr:MAG: hypothetical protein EON58_19850 [Alphaproteobacteria bacterium]